jgi:CxxC-x17-CxxC domain-containing protein
MAQLAEEVRDAVIGNVGTTLAFRVGAEDAEFLEKEFSPAFLAPDVVNLGFSQVYMKLMIDGVASYPFSATTLPPIKVPHESFKKEIITLSQQNFGTPREKVEDVIQKWSETIGGDTGSGDRRNLGGATASHGTIPMQNYVPNVVDARPQIKMYDAVCAVCGKKTQVPFEPDPNRPVFCKEHIGMAGEYKAKTQTAPPTSVPVPTVKPVLSPMRPASGEFVARPPVERSASLRDLAPSRNNQQDTRHQQFSRPTARLEQPFKQNDNLQALRDALKKSQEQNKFDQKKEEPQKPEVVIIQQPIIQVQPKPQQTNSATSGTLRPGDSIEL